jgi:two-component system, sensor histidine kinase
LIDSKKYFVRHISHELRTPLNTAFLGLRLLSNELKESKDPKDIERYETLRDVNLSCTAAVDILNDLLCYEKLQRGMLDLHKEHVTVDLLLRDCISMFSVQARDCGVDINLICAEVGGEGGGEAEGMGEGEMDTGGGGASTQQSLPVPVQLQPFDTVFVDKFKINQVIRNLISNALKFTPRGGRVSITARIILDTINIAEIDSDVPLRRAPLNPLPRQNSDSGTLELKRYADSAVSSACRGRLIVVVTDTGAGISKENQGRLFKEIIQFSPEKLQGGGGSGLGLWITKGIVDLHDGSISVFSEGESMGSSFTVEMPVACWPAVHPESGSEVLHVPSAEAVSVAESLSESAKGDKALMIVTPTPGSLLGPGPSTVEPLPTFHSNPVPPILHVLVVDDSPLNRKMLLKSLRSEGHICLEAVDGLDAVAAVKERIDYANGGHQAPFDVILMDFVMPNMDGPTATKEIRALGYTAPIFGVTGNGKHLIIS